MGASYPYVVLKLGFGPNVSVVAAILGYLVIIPIIYFVGEYTDKVVPPGRILIRDMSVPQIRNNYLLFIGAGCVATPPWREASSRSPSARTGAATGSRSRASAPISRASTPATVTSPWRW